MGLLRTLFIILLVYYIFKVISKRVLPYLLQYAAKKAKQSFGDQFGQFQQKKQKEPFKKEGEVTIDKMPKIKTSNKGVGDYVDYEEID